MSNEYHIPVLLNSVIEYLINCDIQKHVIVDGTAGGGGYSVRISESISDESALICLDKDENAVRYVKERLQGTHKKIIVEKENFANIRKVLNKYGYAEATGIVLDLGLSSYQLTDEDGFSYMRDTRLDMRADKESVLDAETVINEYGKKELERVFGEYGEIRNSRRLVTALDNARHSERIQTTGKLAELIRSEYGMKGKSGFGFMSRIFQALRIEVNNELEDLKKVLEESFALLCEGGRMVVVTYHSLEDRIVKNFFRSASSLTEGSKKFRLLNKKVVKPERAEILSNSKARSAKLRAAELIYAD